MPLEASLLAIKLFQATLSGISFLLEIHTLHYQSYCVGKLVFITDFVKLSIAQTTEYNPYKYARRQTHCNIVGILWNEER